MGQGLTPRPGCDSPTAPPHPASPTGAPPRLHASLRTRSEVPPRPVALLLPLRPRPTPTPKGPPHPHSTIEPEALRRGNMSSLGFTSKEQRNLGLLVHLMTSNPKILYAPAGSEADRVILKVRESALRGLELRVSSGA